jgi:ribosomal protein L20A (L18A)
MKPFNLSGEFKLGSQWKQFSKELPANDEEHAKDLLMARFGSKHKVSRRFINILSVSEVSLTNVSEPADQKSAVNESTVLQEPKNERTEK